MITKKVKHKRYTHENEYAYIIYDGKKVSKNKIAKQLVGYRNEGHPRANALFYPAELGYACPICGLKTPDRLEWSEYAGMIWCPDCNIDIPSCLCVKYPEPNIGCKPLSKRRMIIKATEIFLMSIETAIVRKQKKKEGVK